jgi:hypothetical protein
VSQPRYSRAPDVVWRLGPDRVLVRRVGGQGEDAAAELMGAAALVWVVLDEPATVKGVMDRLPSEGLDVGASDLELLVDRRWLVSSPGGLPTTWRSTEHS